MALTGQRHPFMCKYKASASKATGKLCFLDAKLYDTRTS